MPSIPCNNVINCQPCDDFPIPNVSAEAPDVDRFVSRFAFLNSIPPIRQLPDFDDQGGGIFLQVGCMRWCWSEVSQDDADDCAARQAVECAFNPLIPGTPIPDAFHPNRIALYYNTAVTGTYTCPDGNVFSYTVGAGTIAAFSEALANHYALGLARQRALQHRVCISNLDEPICENAFYTRQITASGPNVAVFPAADLWTLVGGTIPPGMTLETGFSSDGITFSGIPTTIGEYSFTVRCTISTPGSPGVGDFMQKTFTVKIVGIEQSTPLPDAVLGVDYSQQLSAAFSSNHELETWSITSGSLPDGLTLSTAGLISGTPTGALAGYNFTVQAQFPVGDVTAICWKEFSITVTLPQPFAYWKMEEAAGLTREDSVASVDFASTAGVGQTAGKIDFAADLPNNSAEQLLTGNQVTLNYAGTGFTICGWFMLPTYDGWPNTIDILSLNFKNGVFGPTVNFYQLFAPADSFPGPVGDVPFQIGWYVDSATTAFIDTTDTFAFNQWHFFRAWYDPSDQKIHLQINNGTKLSSAASFLMANAVLASFGIEPNAQRGRVDEVGFWKEVLTDESASNLYNSGMGARPPLP